MTDYISKIPHIYKLGRNIKSMSQRLILLVILFVSANLSVFGQTDTTSEHRFSFYINEKEKLSAKADISIVVSGDTIASNKVGERHYFPFIDTSEDFNLIVRVNDITFSAEGYPAWVLNRGSKITFAKQTKLKKLISVAEYDGMTRSDEEWEWYSKRFFVIDRIYTIDIENRNRIKELQFLIISPNNSGNLITTQKIIK